MGVVFYIFIMLMIPFVFQYVCKRFTFFNFLGVTISGFLTGMLAGNLLPASWVPVDMVKELSGVLVCLGIVLVLLVTNLKVAIRSSFKVLLGYFLCVLSVITVAVVWFFVYGRNNPLHYVSGMLTASYVGGTPNMAAVKIAFGIDEGLYTTMFLCDVVASSVYLLFVMVFAHRMLKYFLKPYQFTLNKTEAEMPTSSTGETFLVSIGKITSGVLIAILIFSIPVGLWVLFTGSMENMSMMYVILFITLLSVCFSFIPRVRNNSWNYKSGDYLFTLFFTMLGSLTNFEQLADVNMTYLGYTFLFLFGSVVIHIVLCRLFGIDKDTMLVTSAAGIMSPPFIPAITNSIKNKDLLVPGIGVAILGLALGNVLGISVVKLLEGWLMTK